jgi:hypothetical protein
VNKLRKAYIAAAATAAGVLGTNLLDGAITLNEVLASVGAGLLAGAAVYKVKNAD